MVFIIFAVLTSITNHCLSQFTLISHKQWQQQCERGPHCTSDCSHIIGRGQFSRCGYSCCTSCRRAKWPECNLPYYMMHFSCIRWIRSFILPSLSDGRRETGESIFDEVEIIIGYRICTESIPISLVLAKLPDAPHKVRFDASHSSRPMLGLLSSWLEEIGFQPIANLASSMWHQRPTSSSKTTKYEINYHFFCLHSFYDSFILLACCPTSGLHMMIKKVNKRIGGTVSVFAKPYFPDSCIMYFNWLHFFCSFLWSCVHSTLHSFPSVFIPLCWFSSVCSYPYVHLIIFLLSCVRFPLHSFASVNFPVFISLGIHLPEAMLIFLCKFISLNTHSISWICLHFSVEMSILLAFISFYVFIFLH